MWLYGARQAAGNKVSLRSLMFPTTWNSRPPEYCAARTTRRASPRSTRDSQSLRHRPASTGKKCEDRSEDRFGRFRRCWVSGQSISAETTQYTYGTVNTLYTAIFEVKSIWNKSNWNTVVKIKNIVWKYCFMYRLAKKLAAFSCVQMKEFLQNKMKLVTF